jgi:hypothetical protein
MSNTYQMSTIELLDRESSILDSYRNMLPAIAESHKSGKPAVIDGEEYDISDVMYNMERAIEVMKYAHNQIKSIAERL